MTVLAELFPERIPNWIGGRQLRSFSGEWFEKLNPANGSREPGTEALDVCCSLKNVYINPDSGGCVSGAIREHYRNRSRLREPLK